MRRSRSTATAPRIRRQPSDAKIKPVSTMRCPQGHEFGLDKDRCAAFFGRLPETIVCPVPACGRRVPVAAPA